MTPEDEEWVRRTRAEQGLGPKVTDPATLAKIVNLLTWTEQRLQASGRHDLDDVLREAGIDPDEVTEEGPDEAP